MNCLIMCEGKTDVILLSYVLLKQYGYKIFKDEKGKKRALTPKYDDSLDEYAYWYVNEDNYVLICSVGGCDNFSSFFLKYIQPIQKIDYRDENIFNKIVIIRDRDECTISKIENDILEKTSISFISNTWISVSQETEFNINSHFYTYLLIIPAEHSGALEDVVLDAFSEDENKKPIVEKSRIFVENIKDVAKDYLVKKRMISKAKLGVTFAVLSPDKVFTFMDDMLKSIDWTRYDSIISTFIVLSNLR